MDEIIKHTKLYVNNIDKRFRLDPIRYLRNEKWLDEVILKEDSSTNELSEAQERYYQRLKEDTAKLSNTESISDMTPDLIKMWKQGKN